MNFCPDCKFMVYTKLSQDKKTLINYCNNCSWEGEYINKKDDGSILVYKNIYSKEFIPEEYIINKYTVQDPTLPRINNIACINKKCLTNIDIKKKAIFIKSKNGDEISSELIQGIKDLIESKEIVDYTVSEVNKFSLLIIINIDSDYIKVNDIVNTNIEIGNIELSIEEYVKPKNEIIFIKYDTDNMKYLYLCTNCLSSWKNK
uniref:DNA-directed RNA polymerase M/15kDa subunit domain-containing protein n=1 Tax=viral metagenome TaxID=1070528 RepID=A0A6C0IXG4_9ZZZZ